MRSQHSRQTERETKQAMRPARATQTQQGPTFKEFGEAVGIPYAPLSREQLPDLDLPIPDSDPRANYYAIEDACWIYQYRDLEQNLKRLGWREARRRVLAQGSLSKEWVRRHGHKPVRLTRRGLEVSFDRGVETLSWKRMQSAIQSRRS